MALNRTDKKINKLTNMMRNLCCAREHAVQFFVQAFFYTVKLHSLTYSVWSSLDSNNTLAKN
jgi:hypothetical protein